MADERREGGTWSEIKGKTKKMAGDVTNDPELRREGERDERVGEIDREQTKLERERSRVDRDRS